MNLIYSALFMLLGFNYINVFLYVSAMENPNGFMLFASPVTYFITRLQNVLDILIFLGPFLAAIAYYDFLALRNNINDNEHIRELYNIVLVSIVVLALLFLVEVPKKGKTARICMFIIPFIMITVAWHIQLEGYSKTEVVKLILLAFAQVVIMQTIGIYIW